MASIGIVYEDSFKLHFQQLPWEYVKKYINDIGNVDIDNKNIAGMTIDIESIDKDRRETLLSDGSLVRMINWHRANQL